jgi:ankyrin repeat protein
MSGSSSPGGVLIRFVVLFAAVVIGVVGVLATAAVLALALLVAVFDFHPSGPKECDNSDVGILRAAYFGDADEVERRIDDGERGDTDDDNRTALYCAARGGQADIVRRLTAAGADPDARNAAGDTALLWAAQQGDLEVIDALLETGADVNLPTNAGQTPLLRAVYAGNAAVVDHLLAAGADPNIGGGADSIEAQLGVFLVLSGNSLGTTGQPVPPNFQPPGALDTSAAELITGTPADNITPLHVAIAQGDHEIAAALLRAGADPDAVALDRYTPLHVSALIGDAQEAGLLLFGGADPTPADLEPPAALARRMGHDAVATVIDQSAAAQEAAG